MVHRGALMPRSGRIRTGSDDNIMCSAVVSLALCLSVKITASAPLHLRVGERIREQYALGQSERVSQ